MMAKAVKLAGKFVAYASVAGAVSFGGFLLLTRKSQFVPFTLTTNPIFTSKHFKGFNPNQNTPVLHDLCVRRAPLTEIRPELLKKGVLVEEFCAGVWSGFGAFPCMRFLLTHPEATRSTRRYLERKYRSPETAGQLWDTAELATSKYPVGTQITHHFEVISHTPTSIAVRCGDSPRNSGVPASDGVFEMTAVVKENEGIAEFGLKSIFFQGEGKSDPGASMPAHMCMLPLVATLLFETRYLAT